jgi:hypothetical protein
MITLPATLTQQGFCYTQVQRDGNIAIYAQQRHDSPIIRYEVIRIQVAEAHTWPNGQTTPTHECYPRSAQWGKQGWTFMTLARAQEKCDALRTHKETT